MNTNNLCPIRGYNQLERPVHDYDICPSCLCEFGVSDSERTHEDLREDWIAQGTKWAWGNADLPAPRGWNAVQQLENIGYVCTEADLKNIARVNPVSSDATPVSQEPRNAKSKRSRTLPIPTPSKS